MSIYIFPPNNLPDKLTATQAVKILDRDDMFYTETIIFIIPFHKWSEAKNNVCL